MDRTISYATRPHPDLTQSMAAYAVGDQVTVTQLNGRGLHLEAAALMKALAAGRKAGADVTSTTVVLSPELHNALTGPADATQHLAPQLADNLARFLARFPYALAPGPAPAHVAAALPTDTPALTDSVNEDDLAWAAAAGATIVFTDAATNTNEWVGAWCWYVDEDRYQCGPVPHLASSLTSERHAAARAIRDLPGPLLIVVDALDVIDGVPDVFLSAQQLPDPLQEALAGRGDDIRLSWVRAHRDCLGNIAADQFAQAELQRTQDALTLSPDRYREHTTRRDRLLATTAAYRAQQQQAKEWFRARAREIIAAEHPDFRCLSESERSRIGAQLTQRMRVEYRERRQAVAPEPSGD